MERVYIKENNFNFRNGLTEREVTDMIVLHHTGGADIDASAEQIDGLALGTISLSVRMERLNEDALSGL